jgi:hypothetical protein
VVLVRPVVVAELMFVVPGVLRHAEGITNTIGHAWVIGVDGTGWLV